MYLIKTQTIAPEVANTIELLAEKSESFRPTHLQILVKEKFTNKVSFVQICNVTVLGEPQLVNFDGVTLVRSRGNSLTFKKETLVNFGVFGASQGQGLTFQLVNPHQKEVEVTIIVRGESSSFDLWGQRKDPVNYLFHRFELKSGIEKIPLNTITRNHSGKFKCDKFQLLSFKANTTDLIYPIIRNITVAGESQFENIDDFSLSSEFFEELRSFEMKEFPSHGKGTFITLENTYDYELDCYMTMVS